MITKIYDRFIVFIGFFITLFPIYFSLLPTIIWQAIYAALPLCYLLIYCPYNRIFKYMTKNKYWYVSTLLLLLGIIYSLIMIGFVSGEYSWLEKITLLFRNGINFLFLSVYIERNFKEDKLLVFSKYYVYCTAFYVLCSCVFLIDLSLRTVWLSFINENSGSTHALELVKNAGLYVTRFGLIGYSGFGCSLLCSFGVLLWNYCFSSKRINFKNWVTILLFLLIGNMFYARSGLLLSILLTLMCVVCGRKHISLNKVIGYAVPFALLIVFIFMNCMEEELQYWIEWMLSPIESFMVGLNNGYLSFGSSGDVMFNMYFLPDSDWTIIFGDGIYKNIDGSYYGHTDVGIMRMMLFGGIPICIFLYGACLSMIIGIYFENKDTKRAVFCWSLLVAMIFFEIKGDALHHYYGLIFALLSLSNCNSVNKEYVKD